VSFFALLRAKWRAAQAANADLDEIWPWLVCGAFTLGLLGLMFMGGMWFESLAHSNPPSLTPTLEDPHGR
jgi:hypothetical protein